MSLSPPPDEVLQRIHQPSLIRAWNKLCITPSYEMAGNVYVKCQSQFINHPLKTKMLKNQSNSNEENRIEEKFVLKYVTKHLCLET